MGGLHLLIDARVERGRALPQSGIQARALPLDRSTQVRRLVRQPRAQRVRRVLQLAREALALRCKGTQARKQADSTRAPLLVAAPVILVESLVSAASSCVDNESTPFVSRVLKSRLSSSMARLICAVSASTRTVNPATSAPILLSRRGSSTPTSDFRAQCSLSSLPASVSVFSPSASIALTRSRTSASRRAVYSAAPASHATTALSNLSPRPFASLPISTRRSSVASASEAETARAAVTAVVRSAATCCVKAFMSSSSSSTRSSCAAFFSSILRSTLLIACNAEPSFERVRNKHGTSKGVPRATRPCARRASA